MAYQYAFCICYIYYLGYRIVASGVVERLLTRTRLPVISLLFVSTASQPTLRDN